MSFGTEPTIPYYLNDEDHDLYQGKGINHERYPLGISTKHAQLAEPNAAFLSRPPLLLSRIVYVIVYLDIWGKLVRVRISVLQRNIICWLVVSHVVLFLMLGRPGETAWASVIGVLLTYVLLT